jgi:hypothetical protein
VKLSSRAIVPRGAGSSESRPAPGPRNLGWDRSAPSRVSGSVTSEERPARHLPPRGDEGEDRAIRSTCSRIIWLQKSTRGARPPQRCEGLAPRPHRETGGARGANRRRKPARGGKVARTVAGPREGALVDGRRSGSRKQPPLTRRRWNRAWLPAREGLCPEGAGRDSERQRRGDELGARSTTPRLGGAVGGAAIAAPARTAWRHRRAECRG